MDLKTGFEYAKNFFGVVGASLSGVTAIFYVLGFLAIQAHHAFLGLTHISPDLNVYLFTGGLFAAHLPSTILTLFKGLFLLISRRFELFIILLFFSLLGLVFRKYLKLRWLWQKTEAAARRTLGNHPILFLISLNALLLWILIEYSLGIVTESNLLFRPPAAGFEWLIDSSIAAHNQRQDQFALLIFFAAACIALLTYFDRSSATSFSTDFKGVKSPGVIICLSLIYFQLSLQIIYLPINFGKLIVSKNYPTATIKLSDGLPAEMKQKYQSADSLFLIHQDGDEYFFYSKKPQEIWQVKRDQLVWIVRSGEASLFSATDAIQKTGE